MKPQRMIAQFTATAALLALGAPAAASAEAGGTLLSGYGGPGQGSQAIIGSGFVNGPGAGGGTSGGSGTSAATAAGSSAAAGATRAGASGARGGSPAHPTAPAGTHVSGGGIQPAVSGVSPARGPLTETGSQSLVLPGGDVLDILLGLVVLALTGIATVLLARRGTGTGPTRKDAG